MDRKKLYRRRTAEEVTKRFAYTFDKATDYADSTDPSWQTADTTIDTARYAGRKSAEVLRTYSRKLRDKPLFEMKKPSEALSIPGRSRYEPEKVVSEAKKRQKQKIKREYARKKAKKTVKKTAETGAKVVKETGKTVGKIMKAFALFAVRHPLIAAILVFVVLLLLVILFSVSSCVMMIGGASGGGISTTYTAKDDDIYGAEADYKAKEADLSRKVYQAEALYPGYDEYRYEVCDMSHDPWCLTSALTVLYADFTRDQVQGTIEGMVDAQYTFSTEVETEVRYKTEECTGYELVEETDEDGNVIDSYYQPYTYYVEVPYDYNILIVKLKDNGIETAVKGLGFDSDKTELYEYMNQTKGERAYLF